MAMLAGLAVAFSLFDRNVNDNVVRDAANFNFSIEKWDSLLDDAPSAQPSPALGDPAPNGSPDNGEWKDTASGAKVFASSPADPELTSQYPGDTRQVRVRITNTNVPSRDADVDLKLANLRVINAADQTVAAGPQRAEFLSFWDLQITRESIAYDHEGEDLRATGTFAETCNGSIEELAAAGQSCSLGRVRGSAYSGSPLEQNPTNFSTRQYRFNLTQIDTGTDQSAFQGWQVKFNIVVSARIPAAPLEAGPGIR